MSASLHPSAIRPITNSTESRVPRTTGLPASTAGSSAMRGCSAMIDRPVRCMGARLPETVPQRDREPRREIEHADLEADPARGTPVVGAIAGTTSYRHGADHL